MNTRELQTALRRLGWDHLEVDGVMGPQTRQAVVNFQAGYAFHRLTIDGKPGPATHRALRDSLDRGGRASAYFRFVEFRCGCGGRYRDCERIKLDAGLAYGLDRYRESVDRPVIVVSGYRCHGHNRAVGGASRSQHLTGRAADVRPVQPWQRTAELRQFGGIGYQGSSGLTRHVDTRVGDRAKPTLWRY